MVHAQCRATSSGKPSMMHQPTKIPSPSSPAPPIWLLTFFTCQPHFHFHKPPRPRATHAHQLLVEILDTLFELLILRLIRLAQFLEDLPRQTEEGRLLPWERERPHQECPVPKPTDPPHPVRVSEACGQRHAAQGAGTLRTLSLTAAGTPRGRPEPRTLLPPPRAPPRPRGATQDRPAAATNTGQGGFKDSSPPRRPHTAPLGDWPARLAGEGPGGTTPHPQDSVSRTQAQNPDRGERPPAGRRPLRRGVR